MKISLMHYTDLTKLKENQNNSYGLINLERKNFRRSFGEICD